ncbi:putative antirepressor protein [Actinobacillus minor NM305]|uniref:Putative antirepressor protein n=1 Tax=Actinobacillus minor NM305 TaxID=637911 RepID=C5S5C6_9PAST|nr:phage antirepressor N-terminal domain-containing protein [Actinobacillus minor]EER45912.1 putative antirepressor protein [Actinobacillus minor NM305]MDY5107602.1 phage antirepressor N-terminal domain-containing protein [Actinobacillus minor]
MKALKAKFLGAEITVIDYNGKPYVPMLPICENIGLDWEAQRQRIQRDDVLSSTTFIIQAVAEDGKNREMVCLPLHYLNGWLFGIDTKRVKSSIRGKLNQYKKECYEVLWQYWETGIVKREQVKARLAEIDEWDKETFIEAQSGSQLMLKRKVALKEIRIERMKLIQGDLFENFEL